MLFLKKVPHCPRQGQYLTHAHSHITRAVAAMDSCFAFIEANQHGIAVVENSGKTLKENPGDMAVNVRDVLAMPWVGIRVPLVLSLSCGFCSIYEIVCVACQSHREA